MQLLSIMTNSDLVAAMQKLFTSPDGVTMNNYLTATCKTLTPRSVSTSTLLSPRTRGRPMTSSSALVPARQRARSTNSASCTPWSTGDHLGRLLADHDRRRVRVAADDVRHHARVGDAQAGDAVHAQPRIDDVCRSGTSTSGGTRCTSSAARGPRAAHRSACRPRRARASRRGTAGPSTDRSPGATASARRRRARGG